MEQLSKEELPKIDKIKMDDTPFTNYVCGPFLYQGSGDFSVMYQ